MITVRFVPEAEVEDNELFLIIARLALRQELKALTVTIRFDGRLYCLQYTPQGLYSIR